MASTYFHSLSTTMKFMPNWLAATAVVPVPAKKWYMSKTFWVQVLMLAVVIYPGAEPFVKEYFSEIGMGWALINIVLRLITKGKVEIL